MKRNPKKEIDILKTIAVLKALNLSLFADSGTLTNASQYYVNAYTGETTSFSGTDDLTPTMKSFYDTELLENHRDQLIFAQLGRKQALPSRHGRSIEWRKWNTLPLCKELQEGVIPTGEKLGMTSINVSLAQYGEYVAVTDLLKLHALDDVIAGAVEELGAAGGKTHDLLVRNVLKTGTNIIFADAYNGDTYVSTPSTKAELLTALASYQCNLTPDMVAKVVTNLQTGGAPTFRGNTYVMVVHPHCVYDLRKHPDWRDAHKYAAPEEIFNGEIGELHGMRFVTSNLAPIIKEAGDSKATYKCMAFGKDAFGVIDPEGAGMETIVKSADQVGGPLNQFSTVGTKFEIAAKILYPERMCTLWCGSSYSGTDAAN